MFTNLKLAFLRVHVLHILVCSRVDAWHMWSQGSIYRTTGFQCGVSQRAKEAQVTGGVSMCVWT